MYKSTFQQIILFAVTIFVIYFTGKHMIALSDIRSFYDFGMVMAFFIAFVLFINYFLRLGSKLIRTLSF